MKWMTIGVLLVSICLILNVSDLAAQAKIKGKKLDPSTIGPGVIETMETAIERSKTMKGSTRPSLDNLQGAHGVWTIPTPSVPTPAHSRPYYAVNKWGDTSMGIAFPSPVDVHGAYFAGFSDQTVWTKGIRVLGYLGGTKVQETPWFDKIGGAYQWMVMDLEQVDRIVIEAKPVVLGAGWYAMDDLTFTRIDDTGKQEKAVVNFDDLSYKYKLTGSNYAGLTWETGTGDFGQSDVHSPKAPTGTHEKSSDVQMQTKAFAGNGTLPNLVNTYQGVIRGDAGSWSYPPDTDGAIGLSHYVETVNRNFAVYDKATGAELVNILLSAFLPNSNGDPRVVFDHHSDRWIVMVTDFSATATIFLAFSLTNDPTGSWYKTSFLTAQGSDAGRWPDYPTLGVDANGIYIAAYMVGGPGHTIWSIDKAPLLMNPPQMGTITAWRDLNWEGAIQPAHTYGTPVGQYFISLNSSSSLKLRRVDPPLTSPTLVDLGAVSVPSFGDPPNAPALGSTTPVNTVGDRLMMSVYRDGSIWTSHTISVSGKAGCRWYEVDANSATLIQSGEVTDPVLYYYFPSIMVNQFGDVAMGFSGSHAGIYVGCYYTGRLAADPVGEMATPVEYKAGVGPWNKTDSYGRNRWGDYSYTTLDPVDETTFWTIQEYGETETSDQRWGTYMAVLDVVPPALIMGFPNGLPGNGKPGPETAITVEIKDAAENYVPGTGTLYYRFNGGVFQTVGVTPLGGDLYEAVIPNTKPGDFPEYYFSAQGDGGTTMYSPSDAPASLYSFEVYFVEVAFEDDFETNKGWSVQSQNISTGEWERANPAGTDAQPEDDHTPSGTQCYVTGKDGGGIGDDDLDGGPTMLTSPTIDLSSGDADVNFYLWFYHSTNGTFEPLEIDVSNNNGASWTNVADISHSPSWNLRNFKVSDHVNPTAQVQVRFTAEDNPNDSVVEALVDDFTVQRTITDATLWADAYEVSAGSGGVVNFSLDAGAAKGLRSYFILGSVSGTTPGFPLPGGQTLPLNWDVFTGLVFKLANSPSLVNFQGSLDAQGLGNATMDTLGPLPPTGVGATLYFAYLLYSPYDFVSNAIGVVIVP